MAFERRRLRSWCVGLSQSGAIEMAKLGFSYEQILNHYYRDAKLKKIEILSQ